MSDASIYFSKIKENGNGFKSQCPRCEGKDWTFSWSTEKNVGCCFRSTCVWYYQKGGVSFARLHAFFSSTGIKETIPEVIQQAERADTKLPDEFKLIEDLDSSLRQTLLAYLDSRGIHQKLVQRAKIGYCTSGKFFGYLIFPVFDDGEVMYWQGRRFKNRTPKFWNPESSIKGDLIYRIGKSRKPSQIVLVESIFNALTLTPVHDGKHSHTLVIALMGSSITETQLDKILMYEKWLKEIVVALDDDALRSSVEIASKFVQIIPCVRIPRFPEGVDINKLGRERAWDIIREAEPYIERNRMKFLNPDERVQ